MPVRCFNNYGLEHIAKHFSFPPRSRGKPQLTRFWEKGPCSPGANERRRIKIATIVQTISPELEHSKYFEEKMKCGEAIVDSGASGHAISDLQYLRNVVKVSPMYVKLANGLTATVTGTGEALIDTGSSTSLLTKV